MGNKRINPDSIDVYIGAYDSDTSAAVANFLNVLGIPQLSYGATSTAFKDTTKYPSFLRTVPADDKLARAVVALLKNYGIQYIQVGGMCAHSLIFQITPPSETTCVNTGLVGHKGKKV